MASYPTAPKAPAVLKAARLIAEVTRGTNGLSSADLSRLLELPKSTVVDLCQSLTEAGCLRREAEHQFLLGPTMTRIARGLFGGYPFLETFDRAVQSVDRLGNRTVIMAVLDESDIAIVAVHHGRAVLPITAKVGLYLPSWTTASGHSLLSEHSQEELAELLERPSVTAMGVPGTLPSFEQLYLRIAEQKSKGYFIDHQQTAIGMCGVSAPLLLPGNSKPAAAITVATIEGQVVDGDVSELGEIARRIAKRCVQLCSAVREAPPSR